MDLTQVRTLLPFLIPIVVIQLGLAIAALLDLVKRERVKLLPKWAWVPVVILVNFIGPIAYFLVGRED